MTTWPETARSLRERLLNGALPSVEARTKARALFADTQDKCRRRVLAPSYLQHAAGLAKEALEAVEPEVLLLYARMRIRVDFADRAFWDPVDARAIELCEVGDRDLEEATQYEEWLEDRENPLPDRIRGRDGSVFEARAHYEHEAQQLRERAVRQRTRFINAARRRAEAWASSARGRTHDMALLMLGR